MADVYATLADGGLRSEPIAITKVLFPDGHVDASWGTPHRVRVLSPPVTGEETRILHMNTISAEGTAGRSAIGCPTAAKTGTTSNLYDAWLDGYNSEYATAVWMGYPKHDVSMTDVHGEPQQGGYLPAEIWHTYMQPVTEGHPCAPLNESNAGIVYQPFFGHFATTGEAAAPLGESAVSPTSVAKPRHGHHAAPGAGHAEPGGRAEPGAGGTPRESAPAEPEAAPNTAPAEPQGEPPAGGGGNTGGGGGANGNSPKTGGTAPPG
jgi:membrane peptidoglycan carboxypeptidase